MTTSQERHWSVILFTLTSITVTAALFYNGRHSELYVLSGIIALITATLFLLRATTARVEFGLPGLFLIALFAWSALAVAWSHIPYSSIMDLGALACGVLFYLTWRLAPDELRNKKTDWFLIAGGLLYALGMLGQTLLGFSPTGAFVNPNSSAGFLNLLWPVAAIAYLQAPVKSRRATATLAALCVILTAMNLPGSIGAAISAVVALAILIFFGMHYSRSYARCGILLGVFILAFIPTELLYHGASAGIERMASPTLAGTSRFTIWSASWEMLQQHPWLGYGPGVFWLAYDAYRLPSDGSSGFFVHNDYLQFWIERGLPGPALLIAIGIACCWILFCTLRNSSRRTLASSPEAGAMVAGIAALAATATHSMVSFSLHLLPFLILCGIHVARAESVGGPKWRLAIPDFKTSFIAKACLLLITIPIAHFAMIGASLWYSEKGSAQIARNQFSKAADSFTTARAIWSLPDGAWYLQANVHLEALRELDNLPREQQQRLVTEAHRFLDAAEARNPYRSTTHLIRGLLRTDYPDLGRGSAVEAFRRALDLNPRDIEARYSLSQVLERKGKPREALETIKHGLELRYSRQSDMMPLTRRARELRGMLEHGAS